MAECYSEYKGVVDEVLGIKLIGADILVRLIKGERWIKIGMN